jgi:hypothetical protein
MIIVFDNLNHAYCILCHLKELDSLLSKLIQLDGGFSFGCHGALSFLPFVSFPFLLISSS